MQKILNLIKALFESHFTDTLTELETLPQSGSDRRYFRLHTATNSYIGTYGLNIQENETFIYFSQHFKEKGLAVPIVFCKNNEGTAYIQEDFGNESLLNRLETLGYTDEVYNLFKESLHQLARLQVLGNENLSYDYCLTAKEFGKQAILSDLLYFKYYFLDTLKAPYDKQAMLNDFDTLASYLTNTDNQYFMFRDFQSRNVMLQDNKPYFIDFQGGMKGAPQYDAASMIWQARAELPDQWKKDLLENYMDSLDEILQTKVDRTLFVGQYYGYVLIRLLQVLGAYGFRGLFERKAQFLTSIPLALRNMKWFIENQPMAVAVPEFKRMLKYIVSDEIVQRFEPQQADENTPLTVYINSFSFLKNGYPKDETENGGGYVFDCRGILNPGRINEYKTQSGQDKEVIDYLEQHTKMPDFLNNVYNIVDISVEDYLKRGFESLMINFGCTGGQHRSVYAAIQTARHLRNKYKVRTVVQHINQNGWKKVIQVED